MESKFYRTALPGMPVVITEEIPYLHSIAIGIWVQTGSKNEKQGEEGLAHFIEHLVFKGTNQRSALEIARSIEKRGGSLDAFTTREVTAFYARTLPEDVELVMDVLSDLLLHPLFDANDIEKERGVVLEEIRESLDSPEELAFDALMHCLFNGHPIAHPIIGSKEVIQSVKRDKIISFYTEHYNPSSMIVAGAGKLNHQKLVELVQGYFPPSNQAPLQQMPPPDNHKPDTKVVPRDGFNQTHIALGRPLFPYSDKRRYALLLFNAIFGSGMSSRLFQAVREHKGLVYNIFSFAELYRETGLFGIYLATDPSKVEQAILAIKEEVEKMRQEGVKEDEFKDAKAQIKGSILLAAESSGGRMQRLATGEIYIGKYRSIEEVIDRIEKIQKEELEEIFSLLLDTSLYSAGLAGKLPNNARELINEILRS